MKWGIAIGVVAAGALLASSPVAVAKPKGCADADVAPVTSAEMSKALKAMVCLINAERSANGVPTLKADKKLKSSAAGWATRMDRENFFAHDRGGSDHRKRIGATGYYDGVRKFRIGENIGWGSAELATPAARVRSWMAGGQHRKNILTSDFRDIGVGIAGSPQTGTSGAVYVLNFGRKFK